MKTAIAKATLHAGGTFALALAMRVSPGFVSQLLSGYRETPPDRCPDIERIVGGLVTAEKLRPDVRWVRVLDPSWPHPKGRPVIDVATKEKRK